MKTRSIVAIHKITVSEPRASAEFTGRYDDEGTPLMRKRSRIIPPGAFFEFEEGLSHLLNLGAVRLPDAAELAALQSDGDARAV